MTDNNTYATRPTERDVIAGAVLAGIGASTWSEDETRARLDGLVESLLAALRESRMIRTVAELDALPRGSVIRSEAGGIFERELDVWREPGYTWGPSSEDISLPAELLWTTKDGE